MADGRCVGVERWVWRRARAWPRRVSEEGAWPGREEECELVGGERAQRAVFFLVAASPPRAASLPQPHTRARVEDTTLSRPAAFLLAHTHNPPMGLFDALRGRAPPPPPPAPDATTLESDTGPSSSHTPHPAGIDVAGAVAGGGGGGASAALTHTGERLYNPYEGLAAAVDGRGLRGTYKLPAQVRNWGWGREEGAVGRGEGGAPGRWRPHLRGLPDCLAVPPDLGGAQPARLHTHTPECVPV